MKSKALKITIVTLSIILLGAVIFFSCLQFRLLNVWDKRSQFIPNLIESYVNKQINGEITIHGFNWHFERAYVNLQAKAFELRMGNNNQFIEEAPVIAADNLELVLKLSKIFTPFESLKKISDESAFINLERDENGVWNIEKIFKKEPKRKLKLSVEEINLPKVSLRLSDGTTVIRYDDLRVFWGRDQKIQKTYHVDVMTHKLEPDVDISSLVNYVKISGTYSINKPRKMAKNPFDLTVDIANLDLKIYNDILSLLSANNFFKEHIQGGSFSMRGSLVKEQQEEKQKNKPVILKIDELLVSNLVFEKVPIDKVDFKTEMVLDENIKINSLSLLLNKLLLESTGRINNWQKEHPNVDLQINLSKFNLYEILGRFPEHFLPKRVLEKIRVIHPQGEIIDGKIHVFGNTDSPHIQSKVTLGEVVVSKEFFLKANKTLDLDFKSEKNKITIHKAVIPVGHSSTSTSGQISNINGNWNDVTQLAFDLKFHSVDLPLDKLKSLLSGSSFLTRYENTFESTVVSGYANMDLNLSKKPEKPIEISGFCKLAKAGFLTSKFPTEFKNINSEINIDNDAIEIKYLFGNMADDYFETQGYFSLRKPALHLQFASNSLNLNELLESNLFTLPVKNFVPSSVSGNLKGVFLDLARNQNNKYEYSGKFTFDNVSMKVLDDLLKITQIKGPVVFSTNFVKSENLNFTIDKSKLRLSGAVYKPVGGKKVFKPELNLKAEQLDFATAWGFLNHNYLNFQIPQIISSPKGFLDLDLNIAEKLSGQVKLTNVSCQYKQPSQLLIRDLSGLIVLSSAKDLIELKDLTGYYGSSAFTINGSLDNYCAGKIDDKNLNLQIKANVKAEEIKHFLPRTIASFFDLSGNMPLDLSIKGNRVKKLIELEARLDKLDRFAFSTWLLVNNSIKSTLKSKFIVTPHSVISKDTQILLSQQLPSGVAIETVLNFFFQVKDIKSPNLSYYINFATPDAKSELKLLGPHISVLTPFNIIFKTGNFNCNTFGDPSQQQTACTINVDSAVAKNYGIGDLNANHLEVNLLSVTNRAVETRFKAESGDWNHIPFKKLRSDLSVKDEFVYLRNLKADIKDGEASANYELNLNTFVSKFNVFGQNVPAHELVNGIWGLGQEVPEGLVDGAFYGTTKGFQPDEVFFNLVGTANIIAKNGKLSHLKSMQKILNAVNAIRSLDINSVFQILIAYQGGFFNYVISSLNYNLGKVSTEKTLLKAPQIELMVKGNLDYNKDSLQISGQGLIPKHSKSILGKLGVGEVNLGNLLSVVNLSTSSEKQYFRFGMQGPLSNMQTAAQSVKDDFEWLKAPL